MVKYVLLIIVILFYPINAFPQELDEHILINQDESSFSVRIKITDYDYKVLAPKRYDGYYLRYQVSDLYRQEIVLNKAIEISSFETDPSAKTIIKYKQKGIISFELEDLDWENVQDVTLRLYVVSCLESSDKPTKDKESYDLETLVLRLTLVNAKEHKNWRNCKTNMVKLDDPAPEYILEPENCYLPDFSQEIKSWTMVKAEGNWFEISGLELKGTLQVMALDNQFVSFLVEAVTVEDFDSEKGLVVTIEGGENKSKTGKVPQLIYRY